MVTLNKQRAIFGFENYLAINEYLTISEKEFIKRQITQTRFKKKRYARHKRPRV